MKRAFILIIPLILLAAFGFNLQPEHDFRSADWGMSENEVRTNENEISLKKKREDESGFTLEGETRFKDGMAAKVAYFFINNKLTGAAYWLDEADNPHKSLKEIDDYLYMKFCRMYGSPLKDSGGHNMWDYNRTRISYFVLPNARACAANYLPLSKLY